MFTFPIGFQVVADAAGPGTILRTTDLVKLGNF